MGQKPLGRNPLGQYVSPRESPRVEGVEQLRNNMGNMVTHILSQAAQAAAEVAPMMEEWMRSTAWWHDRTGEARTEPGLHADLVIIEDSEAGLRKAVDMAHGGYTTRRVSSRGAGPGSFTEATSGGQNETYPIQIIAHGDSDHNIWLEIAMGGRYAIIGPSVQIWGQVLKDKVKASLEGSSGNS